MASRSIAKRVTAASIMLVVLVFLFTLAVNYLVYAFQAEKASRRALEEKLNHIADVLTVPLAARNTSIISSIAQTFTTDPQVTSLTVSAPWQSAPVYEKTGPTLPDSLTATREIVYDSAPVGSVTLWVSPDEYSEQLAGIFWYGMAMAVIISAALYYGLNIFLTIFLSKPLETLCHWTDMVALGKYREGYQEIEDDELKVVAAKFKEMAEKVDNREQRLIDSERRFRDLSELLPQVLFEVDLSGNLTYTNISGYEIFGYAPHDFAKGINIFSLISPDDHERARANIRKRIAGEEVTENEYTMLTKNGRVLSVLIYSAPVLEEGVPVGMRGIIIDVSDRKRLQNQLIHSQKMEAVGTLASGIAHDFNNLLQMISGYSEYLLMNRMRDKEDRDGINRIREAAQVASSLVARILTFSRKRDPERKPLNLNSEVRRAAEMLSRTLPRMVELKLLLAEDLWPVSADAAQMDQILLNLSLNARDAMPEGGTLSIATENVHLSEENAATLGLPNGGDYVRLKVSDTGLGIEESVRQRIFEPFFTTKEVGKGTGLGLSTVFGIAGSHGGTVACDSAPGQGAVFSIYLPRLVLTGAGGGEELAQNPAVVTGTEHILLVDDEKVVRELATTMLEKRGFKVTEARTGEEAVSLYAAALAETSGETFDGVILDLGMPGMGGMHCLEELKKLNPKVKVLVASGYTSTLQINQVMDAGAKGFIAKPYKLTMLINQVREMLDG